MNTKNLSVMGWLVAAFALASCGDNQGTPQGPYAPQPGGPYYGQPAPLPAPGPGEFPPPGSGGVVPPPGPVGGPPPPGGFVPPPGALPPPGPGAIPPPPVAVVPPPVAVVPPPVVVAPPPLPPSMAMLMGTGWLHVDGVVQPVPPRCCGGLPREYRFEKRYRVTFTPNTMTVQVTCTTNLAGQAGVATEVTNARATVAIGLTPTHVNIPRGFFAANWHRGRWQNAWNFQHPCNIDIRPGSFPYLFAGMPPGAVPPPGIAPTLDYCGATPDARFYGVAPR